MQDLTKIDSKYLKSFMEYFSTGLGTLALMLLISRMLPFYFAPVVGLLAAMGMYTLLFNHRSRHLLSCALIPYSMFYCLIAYSFTVIIINLLYISGVVEIPREISFFDDPFLATLILDPACFVTLLIVYLRRKRLKICLDCRLSKGSALERGRLGEILTSESRKQLLNLTVLFGVLSVAVWLYYLNLYDRDSNVNDRDWYVFLWINLFAFLLDASYYGIRYYNIYLDLRENGVLMTEDEIEDMSAKTYLRFYVICGNHIYLDPNTVDRENEDRSVIDSPFVLRRNVNGMTISQVKDTIDRLTGIKDGELRFFYGRWLADMRNHRIMRYFYFIDGNVEDLQEIPLDGSWMDFDLLKTIYSSNPGMLSKVLLSDMSRMTTVVLTQKIFNDKGYRKIKAKSYQPTFNLVEVRKNHYDFQDDKWIRISMFNSDNPGYTLRRWWRNRFGAIARNLWERNR